MALGNIHIFCSITVNLTNLSRLDTFVCQICFANIIFCVFEQDCFTPVLGLCTLLSVNSVDFQSLEHH